MASRPRLWTFSEAARELGTNRNTVAGLCNLFGIEAAPNPGVANGKAITDRDLDRIRNLIREQQAASA